MEKIDLHTHTNMSDGLLSPEELVVESIKRDCKKIAITDHEIVRDYKYLEKKYGIRIINGVEFNTSVRNLHLLGYGMSDINSLSERIDEVRIKNEEVCFKVVSLLRKAGYDISVSKIISFLKENGFNYEILDKRKIVKYLIHKGYANSVLDAYNKLIGVNQEFYVPNYKITPCEAIDMVIETGGIPVWAHPNTVSNSYNELYEMARRMKEHGLCGLEIRNGKMKLKNSLPFIQMSQDLGLIQTVGSDFHDPSVDEIGLEVDEKMFDEFHKKLTLSKR